MVVDKAVRIPLRDESRERPAAASDQAPNTEASDRKSIDYRLTEDEADRLVALLKAFGHEEIKIRASNRERETTSITASARDHQRITALIRLLVKERSLPPKEAGKSDDNAWLSLGLALELVDAGQIRRINPALRGGLKVVAVRPESPAAKRGVREGDVLIGLSKWETVNLDDVAWVLDHYESRDGLLRPAKVAASQERIAGSPKETL